MKKEEKVKKQQSVWLSLAFGMIIVFVLFFLWKFNDDMKEAENAKSMDMLNAFAEQATLVAENKLTSTINVLKTASKLIVSRENLRNEEILDYLRTIAEENDLNRIGIADGLGNVWMTSGFEENISECPYFKTSMAGEIYTGTCFLSEISREKSVIISIPIEGRDGTVKGVLYGDILAEDFNVYADTIIGEEDGEQFVHIIDSEGDYIVQSPNKNRLPDGEENFFTLLRGAGADTAEISACIENEQPLYKKVVRDGKTQNMLFTPMDVNNWCVVTVLNGEAIQSNINYSEKIVFRLIFEILAAIAGLALICYGAFSKEKVIIKKLNKELTIKDRIFQMAITRTGNFVFTYDTKKRRLEFMNSSESAKKILPQVIEDFPNNIPAFISQGSAAYIEILHLLDEIQRGTEDIEGSLSLDFQGEVRHYNIHIINIIGNLDGQAETVGILEDVTEEKQKEILLREQMGMDPLTKVYNRAAAEEKINHILKTGTHSSNAFLIIDLDNFKGINDSMGHLTGDKVLIDVVRIIRKHVRPYDIVCRLGGDEFIIFLVDIPQNIIHKNVEALIKKLNLSYELEGSRESISASVGIAAAPKDGMDFKTLYEKADRSLYEVKKRGKNSYAIYGEERISG